MRKIFLLSTLFLSVSFFAVHCPAQDLRLNLNQDKTDQQLNLLDKVLDDLNSSSIDRNEHQRSTHGSSLNQAFVALTGEAVNPLFGVTALGIYNYFKTPEHLRDSLPIYDQPMIWVPLLGIVLLMLFNSTICEAFPFLKVPLNALGDMVNKAGAVAILPLVVKMFADSFSRHGSGAVASVMGIATPVAHAGEAGLMASATDSFGWLLGAVIGVIVYGAVWLTFNVVDVLILICPFPGVDAILKSFRLSMMGLLTGANHLSPETAVIIASAVVLVSLFLAGWSFRLSIFGLVFSTDILFFRKRAVKETPVNAFSCVGMKQGRGLPMRTWGRVEKNDKGEIVFSYKPWLVLSRRESVIGEAGKFDAGRGLLNPFVVSEVDSNTPWLRMPPRYRGQEDALANALGLRSVVNCGVSGALRTWLSHMFGGSRKNEAGTSAS